MKKILSAILLISLIGFSACDKNNDNPEPEIPEIPSVVVNELLPKNSSHGVDQDGEYDDWIELYNPADVDQDISGFYLSDSKKQPDKWKFPEGTIIGKMGYLIVWCDEDTTQAGLHTNYKLSADGENVVFADTLLQVINIVEYPATVLEQSWARKPNGTGDFEWSVPTFDGPND